jgi:hypothetical protein
MCVLASTAAPSKIPQPRKTGRYPNKCRKTRSRIGKHGSLRMPIRSLVSSCIIAEKGPTAIALVPRHCRLSCGAPGPNP